MRGKIADITIYPVEGAEHSAAGELSALAGYAKALFRALPLETRSRHVVLSNVKSEAGKTYNDSGLEVRECWRKGSLWFVWDIWRQFRANPSWRVVHMQHEFNQFGSVKTLPFVLLLLFLLRFVLRRKVAITLHEVIAPELIDPEFLRRTCIPYPAFAVRLGFAVYYRCLGLLAHALVVQDEHFAGVLHERYGISTEIVIVRIGTEEAVPMPRDQACRQLGVPADRVVLMFFGTFDWRKGLDILVEAFSLLPRGKFALILGGGFPVRIRHTEQYQKWWTNIESQLQQLDGIFQIGFIPDEDIPCIFGAADLVVLPYLVPQRVSAVFNHAVSFAVPCIVSDTFAVRAMPEMIFPANAQDLAAKIAWAADGKLSVLKQFAETLRSQNSWSSSADAMACLHEKLIAKST